MTEDELTALLEKPAPCDCIDDENGSWVAHCYCGNPGDCAAAGAWAGQQNLLNTAKVPALIAEIKTLREDRDNLKHDMEGLMDSLNAEAAKTDALREENERLDKILTKNNDLLKPIQEEALAAVKHMEARLKKADALAEALRELDSWTSMVECGSDIPRWASEITAARKKAKTALTNWENSNDAG